MGLPAIVQPHASFLGIVILVQKLRWEDIPQAQTELLRNSGIKLVGNFIISPSHPVVGGLGGAEEVGHAILRISVIDPVLLH